MAKYHTSIKTLPIWNFTEVLQTHDFSHLWIDEVREEDLSEVWKDIYNEYCKAAKVDNRHFKQIAKIEELKLKVHKIEILLALTQDSFKEVREEAKKALKGYNYIFRTDKPYKEELERLMRQLSSLVTKLKIEESKLPKEDKKEGITLMKQAVSLENIFTGRSIDIYTTTVEKWIALNQLAKEKVQAQRETRKQR